MNARFINSTLQNTSLIETNLEQSHFIQSIILQNDFNSACLRQADFLQAQIVQGNNFTNADLYQAKLTNEQFEGKKFTILKHDFRHARFPNGTFSLPNLSRNLIQNGNAEIDCLFNNQTAWTTNNYSIILSTDTIENDTSHWGNCSFILTAAIRVYQTIQLHSYKLLIDTNNARISFATFANCEQSYFEINMYRSDHILHQSKIYSKPIKSSNNTVMLQYGKYQYPLPIYTRYITIYFGIETFQIDRACYFDNIALFIF
ncbi:hypothetical protein I4U23_018044 [Adineta vaga]|nr:hypothetical protein I4U23_018044 [Adineta vaga]